MTTTILIALYWLIVLSVVLIIISQNRNPIKALPWILVVLLLPVAGLVLYIFLGEDLRHVRIIDRRIYSRITHIPFALQDKLLRGHAQQEYTTPLRRLMRNVADSPLLPYEDLSIYTTGKAKYEVLLHDIHKAKHHIHLEYYDFEDDDIGRRIQEALKTKASEGVRVRIIYDDVGTWKVKRRFWKELRKSGAEVYPFMKVFFPLLSSRVNYRNHRKLVIIDGRIGYVGGMNVADRYEKGDVLGNWRDTHFRFTGPAVALLQRSFTLDWHMVSLRVINIADYFLPIESPQRKKYSNSMPLMQLIPGVPTGKWRTIEQAMICMIMHAKKDICIETPYLLPTEELSNALQHAALSDVRIRLLIPARSDVPSVHYASLSFLEELMDTGIEIYQYEGGFLHSKLLMVDGEVAMGGSANLDFRSLEHNFELVSIFYDADTTLKLNRIFEEDLRLSRKVDLEEWKNRSKWERFKESVMRLFSPLM